MWYFGARVSKSSYVGDIWKTYFTSSKYVKRYVSLHGDPDIVKVTKVFKTAEECFKHERRVLIRVNASKNPKFLNRTNGFGDLHNYKDGFSDKATQDKVDATIRKKYGGRLSASPIIKDKIYNTNISRYGEHHTLNCDKVKNAREAANIEKYGTVNPFSSRVWIESRVNPMHVKKHYDAFCIKMRNKDWTARDEKTKRLNMETHGVEYYYQSDEFKEKYKSAMTEKYGVDHYYKSDEWKKLKESQKACCPFGCKENKRMDRGNFSIHMQKSHGWTKEQVKEYHAKQIS